MRAQRSSYATLQEKLLGLTLEPFANLSPPFRELSPAVFLHHASPCLYIFKHGFLDDPHVASAQCIPGTGAGMSSRKLQPRRSSPMLGTLQNGGDWLSGVQKGMKKWTILGGYSK